MTRIPAAELLALKEQMTPAMRPETTSEHLARDMAEGCFPAQSPVQMVPVESDPTSALIMMAQGTADHNAPDVAAVIRALITDLLAARALLEQAEAVLEPFSEMAGEMFARNWNKDSVAISFVGVDGTIRLTFAEFMGARSTLAALRQHQEASHG